MLISEIYFKIKTDDERMEKMGIKILHLSDLHISSSEDNNYQLLRKNIIKYIEDHKIKVDIIAFTGDVINRNDKAAFSQAMEFFNELLATCELTVDRLLIVPGNHDMDRNENIERLLDTEEIKSDQYLKTGWKYLRMRMDAYTEFMEQLGIAKEDNLKYGFGVKVIKIENKTICFNLLNSAWSNKGNNDYRNLVIGKWQLEHNRNDIAKVEDRDITITMLHHPLSWFTDEEAEMLRDYMCHEDKLKSHILLHGHIHDSKTQAENTPGGGFVSLITGIGYPRLEERKAGQPKICECRFSVYDIDVDNQTIDNFCLTSTTAGNFVPDTTLYNGSEDGHYTIDMISPKSKKREEEIECMELDPIPVVNCWSGRTEELDLLSKDNTNVIAISGVGGQGKTALAAKFMRDTPEKIERFNKKLWVDCRELPSTMHVKLLNLIETITGGAESTTAYKDEQLSDTIKRFFKHISKERILIVFDNIDAYVNLDSEELVGELCELIEVVLTRQNDSLIILTCRIPIYDSRANFRTIKLDGLKEPEGISFLKNRGVQFENEEDEEACKQIIKIIKGHPWWLGLIAGQMLSAKMSPKEYLDENRDGILARDSQVENYFGAIWKNFNTSTGKVAQHIVRFLAETARPLSCEDLSILIGENFKNTDKAVKMLLNLNLLIAHTESKTQSKCYQVHPLVREFIHNNYDTTIQKPYVDKLVELIIGSDLYKIIFISDPTTIEGDKKQYDPKDIIDSVETCLTSRNTADALIILSSTYILLVDNGYHAEFLSLGERILNGIDWKKEEMGTSKKRAQFVGQYLDLLVLQDQSRARVEFILTSYENVCEKNTIPYSGFLAIKANILWRCENYKEAWKALCDYEDIYEKTKEAWRFSDMDNLKGMILREMNRIDDALEVFNETLESSEKYGNIAKCYHIRGDLEQALDNLRICLRRLLDGRNVFSDYVNLGYAYFWIAQIYDEMGEGDKAKIFLLLCQDDWKEYAPGLLPRTEDLLKKLGGIDIRLEPAEVQRLLEEFLGEK